MSDSTQIAVTTVQSLIVVLNIAGNSLVCVIIAKNQEMRYVGELLYKWKKLIMRYACDTAEIKM